MPGEQRFDFSAQRFIVAAFPVELGTTLAKLAVHDG